MLLGPEWMFHPGDDVRWAAPGLNEAGWTRISARKPLSAYGFGDTAFGWYRLHVHLTQQRPEVAISVAGITGRYELYANGERLGGRGDLQQHSFFTQSMTVSYPVPERLIGPEGDLVVALRVSLIANRRFDPGFSNPLGGSDLLLETRAGEAEHTSYANTHLVLIALLEMGTCFFTGSVALLLFLAMRERREYLLAAAFLFLSCARDLLQSHMLLSTFTLATSVLAALLYALTTILFFAFVWQLLRLHGRGWAYALAGLVLLGFLCVSLHYLAVLPLVLGTLLFNGCDLLAFAGLTVAVIVALRRGQRDGWVFLPIVVAYLVIRGDRFFEGLYRYPHEIAYATVDIAGFSVDWNRLVQVGTYLTMAVFVVLRTVRIAYERAEAANEMEAAQRVQQVLLGSGREATPGFAVETVYRPAQEVGGDFFFVSPGEDASLLVVVGDVSGKGLLAAMRVSMILGVLQSEESRSPGKVLARLNDVLLLQRDIGFTTACCVRVERDGRYTLANAGHLSPYQGGVEVETEPALPLGLASDQQYPSTEGVLARGETLMLISDGVIEARSESGELFGFERTARLTADSAAVVGETAQRFGQDDDITVVSVALAAA